MSTQGKSFDYALFDPKKVLFGKKIVSNGKPGVTLKYEDQFKPLCWQTPLQVAPFGVSEWADAKDPTKPSSFKLTINVTDPIYVEFCRKLDDTVLDAAAAHSQEWFGLNRKGEVRSRDDLIELYVPLLRPGKGNYPPTNKFTVRTGGDGGTQFFRTSTARVPYTQMKSRSDAAVIVDAINIYFFSGASFGLTVVARQVLFRPKANAEFQFDTSSVEMQEAIADNEAQVADEEMPDANAGAGAGEQAEQQPAAPTADDAFVAMANQ